MSARWVRAFLVALVVFAFGSLVSAQAAKTKAQSKEAPPPAAVETESSDFPPAELTIGFQSRDSETEGIGDLLIPVWNPGGKGLLFLNPRTAITDDDAEEGNLGLGYRQLFPKLDLILGANAYYDYRDTGYSNYDQWGVGFELLSQWLDARLNYYDPDDKRIVVASETQTTVSQSIRTTEGWDDPYARNHEVLQDYVTTRTRTTTTANKTYEQYEQALGGYDWEIGLRMPIKSDALEARVFGGYYDFDRDFGANAQGWKARAEVRLLSSLFLDAGLYENEDLTGSDWFAGARLSVPLDLAKISQGRNPFARAKSRLRGEPRDAAARLTEMVMRDPQVRLEQSKFLENKALATEESTQSRDRNRTTYVLLPDVMFVHGDFGSPTGNGTAGSPFSTIQQGANAVFGTRNVYVFNASKPYNENVVLLDGTTLWGSGSLIPGYGGKSFGSGIHPVVDGLSLGPSITMANQTTVRGFSVRNTDLNGPEQWVMTPASHEISRVGIYGDNVTDLALFDNILSGNTVGAQVFRGGDFNLLFQNNRVTANEGRGVEVWANGDSGGTFNADISRSLFSLNGTDPLYGTDGLFLFAENYGESIASVQDSQFLDNPGIGMEIIQNDSFFAMALLNGLVAERNGIGIASQQQNNQFSLVNISDTAANNNDAIGIMNIQDSALASVGVIGMPDGLDTSVAALASMFSLTLPEEVGLFLAPSGPVTANNNGGYGVYSEVASDGFLALGGLFDITANINQLDGIRAMNRADNGIAVGLAGSSENLADILQLGTDVAGLFDLDLPVSIPGGGQMQANGNTGAGFVMQTTGGNAAINAVVGLDTIGNVNGPGAFLGTYCMTPPAPSTNFAISAIARLNTSDNGGAGLLFDVQGLDDAAIGIIADVNASGNGDSGITASVDSPNGFAALLTLSTDALRPAAALLGEEFLGGPFTLPGEAFGPVVASGNTGDGFTANVTGYDFSLAAFLDTQADGNTGDGFDVTVGSANGMALAAFVSSDVIYDILPDVLGGDPIPYNPLGGLTANGNATNGFRINLGANGEAALLMVGVEADDNAAGDGIQAGIISTNAGSDAILVDTWTDHNAGRGVDLNLNSYGISRSALVYADADDNGRQGIRVLGNSANSNAYALFAGADTDWNGIDGNQAGIVANLTAAGDAAVALTDTYSEFNYGRGAGVTLNAGGNASLFAGDFAADDLDFAYDYSGDIGPLFGMIPRGDVVLSDNGAAGLYADLTSANGNAGLFLDGVNANYNGNAGYNLTLNALNGNVNAAIDGVVGNYNGSHGINLAMAGAGGNANAWLNRVTTVGNGTGGAGSGIQLTETYAGGTSLGGQQNVAANNVGNGVRIVADAAGSLTTDFGGGADSLGQSSFYGNGNVDFRYNNGAGGTILAQNNWWGVGGGTFAGSIDHSNPLPADPNAP